MHLYYQHLNAQPGRNLHPSGLAAVDILLPGCSPPPVLTPSPMHPPLTAGSLPPIHLDLCLSPAVQCSSSQWPVSGPWPVRPWASLHLSILSNSPTLSTLGGQVPAWVLWYCDCARPVGAAQAQIP